MLETWKAYPYPYLDAANFPMAWPHAYVVGAGVGSKQQYVLTVVLDHV